jgi:acyl-CoA synthetase (AMP-forming)/AMP-acid ligase II
MIEACRVWNKLGQLLRMHYMSPFIVYQKTFCGLVTWSVAPDFSCRLVTRRFNEARKLTNQAIPGLDLSSIRFLQSAAEPIRPADTREYFESAFKDFILRDNWFCEGYGLAKTSVVFCTYLHEYVTTQDAGKGNDISPFVAVGHRRNFHHSQVLKVVDPQTLEEVEDGAKGEKWVAGPSAVALGYYKKPELKKETFQAKIEGVDLTFYVRATSLSFKRAISTTSAVESRISSSSSTGSTITPSKALKQSYRMYPRLADLVVLLPSHRTILVMTVRWKLSLKFTALLLQMQTRSSLQCLELSSRTSD